VWYSDWEKDAELNTMQKRISKEQAKYYQMKGDWYMAYECLKITLAKMKQLKENTTRSTTTAPLRSLKWASGSSVSATLNKA